MMYCRQMLINYFNPRSGERSDLYLVLFQFQQYYFNPRSGERSDNTGGGSGSGDDISIHAPANGATWTDSKEDTFSLFQSTLRRTERPIFVFDEVGAI